MPELPAHTPPRSGASDADELRELLVGIVASAISSPTLPPHHAIHPWGEQAERVVEQIVEPLLHEIWRAVHVQRFAAQDGTLLGPDVAYNGTIIAARTVREASTAWAQEQHVRAAAVWDDKAADR